MDKAAFAESVQAHQDALFRVAYAILQNRGDALDAVQEAVLRAWLARRKLKNEALFKTRLTRIVIRWFNEKMTFPTAREGAKD